MRRRFLAATATAAACLLLSPAPPASASENADGPIVPWSASFETASATGQRWQEGDIFESYLVTSGTFTNTGQGCYSVWTDTDWGFGSTVETKRVEMCGPGSVDAGFREDTSFQQNVWITVCKGTENTDNCGEWILMTWWPI